METYTMEDMVNAATIMQQFVIPEEFEPGRQYETLFESFYVHGFGGEKPKGMAEAVYRAFRSAIFWIEGGDVQWALVRR